MRLRFAGTVTTGAVVSWTVTVNEPDVVLPASSVAEQCTVVVPSGNIEPDVASQVTASVPATVSSASVMNAAVAPAGPVASLVMFAGSVSVGAVVSTTVTSNEPPVALPCASSAEQSTVVVPSGYIEPLSGVHVTATVPSTTSLAEGAKATAAPLALVASAVMSLGKLMVGTVVSETVIPKSASPVLPAWSIAVQVTVVVASSSKTEPDGGAQVTGTMPSTMSVAAGDE